MISIETLTEGRIRFATKNPTAVEVMLVDGKMFVSEVMPKPSASPVSVPQKTDKELDFLRETK